ncbi:hypothetical protein WDW89_03700 [Deltaproteobacteria bacterium TL4]
MFRGSHNNKKNITPEHTEYTERKGFEIGIHDLGYSYKRQREEGSGGSNVVTNSIVAEATLAIWRKKPHQAKFRRKEHFGKLYTDIGEYHSDMIESIKNALASCCGNRAISLQHLSATFRWGELLEMLRSK